MAKQLKCADVGFNCDAQINAETEDEVMAQAGEHARTVHGLSDSELQESEGAMRAAIRDV
jgi:predicted small metal-binding protein